MQQQGPNGSPRFAPAPGHPFRQQVEQRGMRLQGQVTQRPAAEDHSTLQRPFRFARRVSAINKLVRILMAAFLGDTKTCMSDTLTVQCSSSAAGEKYLCHSRQKDGLS